MRVATLALIACAAILTPARAQTPGTCALGTAENALVTPNLFANLFNNGSLAFGGSTTAGNGYLIPRRRGKSPLFAASLWVGGKVNGEVRVAGARYGAFNFWPGPLNLGATLPNSADCSPFDRVYVVSPADIVAYEAGRPPSVDLRDWPVGLGAAAVDAAGNSIVATSRQQAVNLAAGERPVLYGGPTAFWVMNDVGGVHLGSGSAPLGVEVQVTAFAPYGGSEALAQSTVYRYKVINRSNNPIDDLHVALWADPDLGNAGDDYVATDTTRGMVVAYNSDEDDDTPAGYGIPPALGFDVLSGLWSSGRFIGVPIGGPDLSQAGPMYEYMRGFWGDGSPVRENGGGWGQPATFRITRFMFPGDPVAGAFWSAEQPVAGGGPDTNGDLRFILSTPASRLEPGASRSLDLAIIFAQGADRLHSVSVLRTHSDVVQAAYDTGTLYDGTYAQPPAPPGTPPLLLPGSDADFNALRPDSVGFAWGAVPGADEYVLQISAAPSFDSLLVERSSIEPTVMMPTAELPIHRDTWTYWRVKALNYGGASPSTAPRRFEYRVLRREFTSFEVVANAAGPLVPAHPGAAAFAGFPTPGGLNPVAGVQQSTNENRWLVSEGQLGGTYREWLQYVLRGSNGDRAFPFDYEMRFTGPTSGLNFVTGGVIAVPFEIWRIGIGTPDDSSDDVRLVPRVLDDDGNGDFGLLGSGSGEYFDSQISPDGDDPYTDRVYFTLPLDMTPGEAGYLEAIDTGQYGAEVLARVVLVSWDGLDRATAETLPEEGTVFRMVADRSHLIVGAEEDEPQLDGLRLDVYPNPTMNAATVSVSIDKAATVRLSVVDALGRTVVKMLGADLPAGETQVRLDTSQLAAGVYAVVLYVDGRRTARTITVAR